MSKIIFSIFVSIFLAGTLLPQQFNAFDKFFSDQTMRIDYYHTGDAKDELVTLDQIYEYGIWAGSRVHLIDEFNNGKYYAKIYDAASGKLIFSKGFNSYFGEYQTSSPALNGIKKTYHESVLIPVPNVKIIFALEKRDNHNTLSEFFRTEIDPADVSIRRDDLENHSVIVFGDENNGDPHQRVDVTIIAEGYTALQKEKFKKDLSHFTDTFLNQEPYKSNAKKFNFYGVFKASVESGVDEPRANVYKNTALNCTFNSLGSERYLLTEDNKSLRDIAANVPYDALYIMVNSKRYGGGGIYNLYCTFTSDNQWRDYLFLHEFGHSFSGLADEYYTSSTAYNDFYPKGVEPVEPNITALLDVKNVKWKSSLTAGIEIPTPWEKAEYDSMDYKWQKERTELNNKIAELKRTKAPEEEIEHAESEYAFKDKQHADVVDSFIEHSKYFNKVGAFEGAGYASKGLYRPMLDCIMFSKGSKPFCKVCEQAIEKVINFYTE